MNANILNEAKGSTEEQLTRTRRDLTILYDVSNAMRTTLEMNHILYIILTGVTAHAGLGFNRAILFLVNKNDRLLEGKMAIGPESGEHAYTIWKYIETKNQGLEDLIAAYKTANTSQSPLNQAVQRLRIPLGGEHGGLLSKAYSQGSPLHITKEAISLYKDDPLLKIFNTNELVIMPLKAKNEVNGIIVADNLYTQKIITEDDLKIFMMLANQGGLAIENSRLYEIVVHKGHTDSLTNLWNHGFFQDTLLLEVEKARHNNSKVSLIIIDIDNFKKINDTYGHHNGDSILTELARILKDFARQMDFVCRYGGEEFAIILPRTEKDQAFTVAERVRERIAQHHFPMLSEQGHIQLTISLGVATFPEDTKTREELIQKADKAMYTAKFIGKNKTLLAEIEPA